MAYRLCSAACICWALALLCCCLQTTLGLQVTDSLSVSVLSPSAEREDEEESQGAHNTSGAYRQMMHNKYDIQYLADITIGGQTVSGVLDTGSFELLVFSQSCKSCGRSNSLYQNNQSTTYTRGSFSTLHRFGSGDAYSYEGFEKVEVGPLVAENMSFWEVRKAEMPVLRFSGIEAIVGVGPPGEPQLESTVIAQQDQELADILSPVPVLDSYAEGQANASQEMAKYVANKQDSLPKELDVRRFSVCLGQEQGSAGHFIWKDDDPTGKPGVDTLSVDANFSWGIKMHSAKLTGGDLEEDVAVGCENGCGALVDSGTSLLVMPRAAALNLRETIQKMNVDCNDTSGLPHMEFVLGGKTMTLPPEAYLGEFIGLSPVDWLAGRQPIHCNLDVVVMSEDAETQFGPLWILGMPFMREYYTTFDLKNLEVGSNLDAARKIHVSKNDGNCSGTPPADSDDASSDGIILATRGAQSSRSRSEVVQRSFLKVDASQLWMAPGLAAAGIFAKEGRIHL